MRIPLLASILTCTLLISLAGCGDGPEKEKNRKGDGSDDFVFKPPKASSSPASSTPVLDEATP
ncbi:hypothetical protein FHW83_003283 [Duganella sp. SG902]|uniref:hypothetical protein n=1 Tax=Duganella sp. SG902 TaxID=2587016 RepID=UPI00159D13F5|nr:hypothetical protein [Duganella sp. SG902]NVM77465.1 hypothetical protein [Duganella sp. SG902]